MKIKKYLLFSFLFLVFLTLVAIFFPAKNVPNPILSRPTPAPSTIVQKNESFSFYNEPVGVLFTLDPTVLPPPESMAMFLFPTPTSSEVNGLLTQMRIQLGIPDNQNVVGSPPESTIIWEGNNKLMTFTEKTSYVAFMNNSLPASSTIVSADQAQLNARAFLDALIPSQEFSLQLVSNEFQKAEENDSPGAGVFAIHYNILLDFQPVMFSGKSAAVSMIVRGSGDVLSVSLPLLPQKITRQVPVPLLSLDSALYNLNLGNGTLLRVIDENSEGAPVVEPNFSSVLINKVSMAYYKNPGSDIVLPVFLFEGRARTESGSFFTVQYFLPATI